MRHLRSEPNQRILRFRKGRLKGSGNGYSFWFHPLNTSLIEVPIDDRELPFIFHGRSKDFQDAVVQGVISYRVVDAEKLSQRVDFSIDVVDGLHKNKPLEKIAGLLTDLSKQFAMDYLVHTELNIILEDGVETIRNRIEHGLGEDNGILDMGLSVVSVRINSIKPEAEVERALQVRVRESIQQQADEAIFERRAVAVEKERAIQENELQNQIELAKREEQLIAQQGLNDAKRVSDTNETSKIAAEGAAERSKIESTAKAESIQAVEEARVTAERERMSIYRDFPADRMMGLAAQELAGKLQKIEHLNLTPDLIGPVLSNLMNAGTSHLKAKKNVDQPSS